MPGPLDSSGRVSRRVVASGQRPASSDWGDHANRSADQGEHPEMQKMHDRTEAKYAEPSADDVRKLREMYAGHHISQALYVIAELGIADLLRNGARDSDELAQ